ncbi:MAG: Gfo/Idh/MocA family oxidoreductase [Acidobacteriota bacterium]|nr:Gfo/Idh/MocA family oxidoreductase [Acidobacteriota bacterium]
MNKLRVAVLGAGSFGGNHIRALREIPEIELAGVFDTDAQRAAQHNIRAFSSIDEIAGAAGCAIVATPTVTHEQVASRLLEAGLDVLVEKPIADSSAAGDRLTRLAEERGRILQIGHLERFNPAITALEQALTLPLFFEVHRLSVFTPRSLDIDVVLDLMIHDLDIVLSFTREMPVEIRAAGISVLSPLVDIANVRLAFASGCIANLTASRVSTEKVRKLRLFQPGEYISVDYQRQEAIRLAIRKNEPKEGVPPIGFDSLKTAPGEPLKLELQSFFDAVRERSQPKVNGIQATNALRVAEAILAKIKEHADLVAETVRRSRHFVR